MRQPERAAGQGRRADIPAPAGGGIDVRELTAEEVDLVDERLPLSRLDGAQTYIVAWEDGEPVGHAHIAWTGTDLGVPEVQDLFVLADRRRRGVAKALMAHAEHRVAAGGHRAISISYSVGNDPARRLYERLGFRDAGVPPKRVRETIVIRGRRVPIDETMVYLVKDLPVDFGRTRSS